MTTLDQYRTDLDRIERGEIDPSMGDDKFFGIRCIHRELTTALWQSHVRRDAEALAGRAMRLMTESA